MLKSITLLVFVGTTLAFTNALLMFPNACSSARMTTAFMEMNRVRCKNCDKYFHCQGNYNAVYTCYGLWRESTAEMISNAREGYTGESGSNDSNADQVANKFGRNGGNCGARYLKAANCAYNPYTRRCQW